MTHYRTEGFRRMVIELHKTINPVRWSLVNTEIYHGDSIKICNRGDIRIVEARLDRLIQRKRNKK